MPSAESDILSRLSESVEPPDGQAYARAAVDELRETIARLRRPVAADHARGALISAAALAGRLLTAAAALDGKVLNDEQLRNDVCDAIAVERAARTSGRVLDADSPEAVYVEGIAILDELDELLERADTHTVSVAIESRARRLIGSSAATAEALERSNPDIAR